MSDHISSLDAERAVVGSILLDPSVCRETTQHVAPGDFGSVVLGSLYALMTGRAAIGEPIDPVTLWPAVQADAMLSRSLRSAADLYAFIEATPTASNVAFYAKQVAEAGQSRRLLSASTRLAQLAHASGLPSAEKLTMARGEIEAIASDYAGFTQVPTLGEVLAVEDDPEDWVIPGLLERMDRLVLTGAEGLGKRLRVDEPIPTPTGWTTMGALRPGDQVFGRDGRPCNVTYVSDVDPYPDAWAVVFNDGTIIEADAEHQWVTVDYQARQRRHEPAVRTTAEIAATLTARGGHVTNHAVPVAAALDLPERHLPIPPYTLGAWLGDGTTVEPVLTLNREDAASIEGAITAEGVAHHRVLSADRESCVGTRMEGFKAKLRNAGLLGHKHIPGEYLRASAAQRWALLRGLMDTDGYVTPNGKRSGRGGGASVCELTLTCKTLIPGAVELVRSLGINAHVAESDATLEGRVVGRRWRIVFQSAENPFSTPRKAGVWQPLRTRRALYRYIVDVRRAEPTPMRCISVDSPDSTYLASRRMVPTHNTYFLRQIAILAAAGLHPTRFEHIDPVRVTYIDAENTERQWRRAAATVAVKAAQSGSVDPRDTLRLHCTGRLDITRERDLGRVHAILDAYPTDMLVIGPLYKLTPRAITTDDDAAPVIAALDGIRERGVCLLIEAHAGHAHAGDGERNLRPRGSAALLGWPEFGFGLAWDTSMVGPGEKPTVVSVKRWRGDREQGRDWPEQMRKGGHWPWMDLYITQALDRARWQERQRIGEAAS